MNTIWEYQYDGVWNQQVIINSAVEQGHTDAYIEDNNALYSLPYTVKYCRYIIDTLAKTATCGTLVMPIRSTEGNEAIWMWLNDDHQLYPFDTPIQKELEAHYNRHEADYDLIIEGRHYTISFTSTFFFYISSVDMTQTNVDSGKVRSIHRIT